MGAQETAETVGIRITNVVSRATPKDKFELVTRLLNTSKDAVCASVGCETADLMAGIAADVSIAVAGGSQPTTVTTEPENLLARYSDVFVARRTMDTRDLQALIMVATSLEKTVIRNVLLSMWIPTISWAVVTLARAFWLPSRSLLLSPPAETLRHITTTFVTLILVLLSNNSLKPF